jgi:V8-like Glu-specific endopeptidase
MVAPTQVTQVKTVRKIESFSVIQPLLGGNSGGPVFDINGRVIGVVTNGPKNKVFPNSCVNINHSREIS